MVPFCIFHIVILLKLCVFYAVMEFVMKTRCTSTCIGALADTEIEVSNVRRKLRSHFEFEVYKLTFRVQSTS